ncbi:MAG: glycosyltransferase family 4 protein [Candidatus Thermoplasmatota archaeon]|nr:glycosyltransferase family 4 protein [Candidatus Thermoplasmatota archaeon]
MTQTKIGMASAYYALMKGGGELYTFHLSNALAERGYDITIICGKQPFKRPAPLSDQFKIEYISQLYFLREWANKMRQPLTYGASLVHYYHYAISCQNHFLKNHNFDVIHTHDPASLHAAIKIKKKYHIPIVASFHGHPSLRQINDVDNVDAILPVSREIKSTFEKYSFKNVYDVPGGVDLSHFQPLNKDKCKEQLGLNGRIILFVGRLVSVKNVSNLLYAFKKLQLSVKDSTLLIVGDGALKLDLISLAKRLSLEQNVIFKGAISYENLPMYYNAADVFILPSKYESYPLVALEAAACNVPIVISSNAKAFLEDFGKDGVFIIDPGDIEKISDNIKDALLNKE